MSDDDEALMLDKHGSGRRRGSHNNEDNNNGDSGGDLDVGNISREDLTGKKIKKKKKSSSKSKSDKSSSSSAIGSGSSSASLASSIPVETVGKLLQSLKDTVRRARDTLLSAADLSNTSPKAMMTRVLFLVMFALVVIGIGYRFSMSAEVEQTAPVAVVEPEEIIVQKLGKKAPKINQAMEKDFGCRELQCVAQCNGKAKPKCLKSRSCVGERDKICQKRCRKTRCEERCKDEPHLGYVEREQGLEKCKDSCTGPTASHNKCVVKCHVKYKPCKSRCFETANKYKCDNPKFLAMANPASSSSSSSGGGGEDEEEEDGGGDSRGSDDAEEDEGGGDAAPPPPKKKSSSSSAVPGLDDDDLL